MTPTPSDTANPKASDSRTVEDAGAGDRYVLAHFSDPHIARVQHIQTTDFFNKRLPGYLRYRLKRHAEHSEGLLTILHKDLQRTKPDHIAVTGDLTQLSLPIEFEVSRKWLQTLGMGSRITVIPGNHDTYIKTEWRQSFIHWLDYMAGDIQEQPSGSLSSLDKLFPTLRIRNRIALIGINTAFPSGLHLATGAIGGDQLEKLEALLKRLSGRHLFRIILLHHPPLEHLVSRRRSLTDAASLRMILERHGAELILFGHSHQTILGELHTPSGSIPAIGAPSVTSLDPRDERRSRYFLYEITSDAERWKVHLNERVFSLAQHRFVRGRQKGFFLPAAQLERSWP